MREEQDELLLKRSDVEQAREEASKQAAEEEARLRQLRVGLDAQEEDLVTREKALADKLRLKDEEVERLVAQRTQELERKHQEALSAQAADHAGKLRAATDAVSAAEAAKDNLAGKVARLEADIEGFGREISMLRSEREKTLSSLVEMQTAVTDKAT